MMLSYVPILLLSISVQITDGATITTRSSCPQHFGSKKSPNNKGNDIFIVKERAYTKKVDINDLKSTFGKRQKRYVSCQSFDTVVKLHQRFPKLEESQIIKPRSIKVDSLLDITIHNTCYNRNNSSESVFLGTIDEYSIGPVLNFKNIIIYLHYNKVHNNGTIEGMGNISFCSGGLLRYHIYPQVNGMSVLQGSGNTQIAWKDLSVVYPNFEEKLEEIGLWKHVFTRLQISNKLQFQKLEWYNVWKSESNIWTFFKSRRAETTADLPIFGPFKTAEEEVSFQNFEAIMDHEGTTSVHFSSFKSNIITFARLFLHTNSLKVLDKLFPLQSLNRIIKLPEQIYVVGVAGTLRPNQFDDVEVMSRLRNFLPFYIYGGVLKDEFYVQNYGRIVDDVEKPKWMDEGNVLFYVREFRDGKNINFHIEFYPKKRICGSKKLSDFDTFVEKLESLKILKKEIHPNSCIACCEEVPSLKRISIATNKNISSMNRDRWHIDIQLETKTELIKWVLKRGKTVQLEDFL